MNTQYIFDDLLQTLTDDQLADLETGTKALVGRGYPKEHALAMRLAHHGEDDGEVAGYHMLNTLEGWAVCDEEGDAPEAVFDEYEHALRRACELGAENKSIVYVHGLEGTVHDRYDYRFAKDTDDALHVRPAEDGWLVEFRGSAPSVEAFTTKKQAVAHARPKAKTHGLTLVVHYADGTVQSRKIAD